MSIWICELDLGCQNQAWVSGGNNIVGAQAKKNREPACYEMRPEPQAIFVQVCHLFTKSPVGKSKAEATRLKC